MEQNQAVEELVIQCEIDLTGESGKDFIVCGEDKLHYMYDRMATFDDSVRYQLYLFASGARCSGWQRRYVLLPSSAKPGTDRSILIGGSFGTIFANLPEGALTVHVYRC